MSFDLSRIRFDVRRDFLGVIMQQGRVQLDADWNEWVAQIARRLQAGTLDTFNGTVVPRITPDGFRIEATGGALTIGPGRIYVDGILAENHGASPNAWDARLAELAGTEPVDYLAQPYYRDPPALPKTGTHLVYLDVWQRPVTAVEDPGLIEQAVGVDTTGRMQTVWQVKVLDDVGAVICSTPDQDIDLWQAVIAPSAGRLTTATGDPAGEPSPCEVPPQAGYRGLENQLYRVEIHTPGAAREATFKWSRDNATVASRVTHINPSRTRITVASLGRDDVLSFHDGEWVEITDDWRELHGLPGDLRRIAPAGGVDRTTRTLTFETALTDGLFYVDGQQATDPARNTRVRRWDQGGIVRAEDGSKYANLDTAGESGIPVPPAGTRLFLEHEILVDFSLAADGGGFRSGDYWCFAARTADARIEILRQAPPLGIHHHYARLAVVTFPDAETDCRTLWPLLSDGEGGCDCSICVTAEGHNSGTATIQQAIDAVKDAGGTVCLGIGTYNLRAPLSIDGARSLRIRGQGWRTVLVGNEGGTVIGITGGIGVALENFSILGTGGGNSGSTAMIAAHGVADLACMRVNIFGIAVGDGIGVGIGLSGLMLRTTVTECVIAAPRGIAFVPSGDTAYLLTAELCAARNVFVCTRSGIHLPGLSMHYGTTRIDHNLILAGSEGGVIATGGCFPRSTFTVADNVIYTRSAGIRGGVDNLSVEGNSIAGFSGEGGDGIIIEEGLDPVALDRLHITGNRIGALGGNAVTVGQRIESGIVSENFIDGMGLGALVMARAATAGELRIAGNRCTNLGRGLGASQNAFAAIQLVGVDHADLLDNTIADIAREGVASAAISAVRGLGLTRARIAGNRIHDIGPIRGAAVAGIRLLPPFDRVAVDDNSVLRLSDPGADTIIIAWSAISVGAEQVSADLHFDPASFIATDSGAFVLTQARLIALRPRDPALSIRGNHLAGPASNAPIVRVASLDHCLFSGNMCETEGQTGTQPSLGLIAARTVTATDNRLRSPGDLQTLRLQPDPNVKAAIVMGNTSSGPIVVVSGAPVPSDIGLTNIFNI